MAAIRARTHAKRIFKPQTREELVRGWLLHAHKGRDRHEEAARRCDMYRYWLGAPAVALSAVVGTSIFTSLGQAQVDPTLHISIGLVSLAAAVLASLQTFYNFADRAERHRLAGTKYKAIIREIEQELTTPTELETNRAAWLDDLRKRLDALEEDAPVVPPRIYESIERRYGNVAFIDAAAQLYGSPAA